MHIEMHMSRKLGNPEDLKSLTLPILGLVLKISRLSSFSYPTQMPGCGKAFNSSESDEQRAVHEFGGKRGCGAAGKLGRMREIQLVKAKATLQQKIDHVPFVLLYPFHFILMTAAHAQHNIQLKPGAREQSYTLQTRGRSSGCEGRHGSNRA